MLENFFLYLQILPTHFIIFKPNIGNREVDFVNILKIFDIGLKENFSDMTQNQFTRDKPTKKSKNFT